MRLEQRTFIDKYIEKIILGVAILLALGILYIYFLGSPYNVDVGGKKVDPVSVEDDYKKKADLLKREVQKKDPHGDLVTLQQNMPDYADRFRRRYTQPLSSSSYLPSIIFGEPGIESKWTDPGGLDGNAPPSPFKLVLAPKAKDISISSSNFVLESDEALQFYFLETLKVQYPDLTVEELTKIADERVSQVISLVGRQSPRDFFSVTVGAVIDPEERLAAYKAVPEAEGRMPESWYQDLLPFVSDIYLERQTMDPATGKWIEKLDRINPLPGSVSQILRDDVKKLEDLVANAAKIEDSDIAIGEQQQQLLQNLQGFVDLLARPEFVPHKQHRLWLPPERENLQLSAEDNAKLMKVNQQISKYENDLQTLQIRSGNLQPDLTQPRPGQFRPGVGPGPEEGYFTPTPTPRPGGAKTPPRTAPKTTTAVKTKPGADPAKQKSQTEDRAKVLQEKLIALYKERDTILSKLNKEEKPDPSNPATTVRPPRFEQPGGLPGGPEDFFRLPGRRDPRIRPGVALKPGETAKIPPIKLWAHDVTVESGKTYRYRVVYRVINPLFNKADRLVAELKPVAKQLEQDSIPSDWAAPVTIDRAMRYFVEEADPQNGVAKFGVYKLYNGYWIHKVFAARTGDAIGSKDAKVDVIGDDGQPKKGEAVNLSVAAVLVDVKAAAKQAGAIGNKGPVAVLVASLDKGQIDVRDLASDKADPDRVRLFNEASGAIAAPAPGGPAVPGGPDPRFIEPPIPSPRPPVPPKPATGAAVPAPAATAVR